MKTTLKIIKGILPAVFCFVIVIVAINTGGADLQKLPDKVYADVKTPAPGLNQTLAQQVDIQKNKQDNKIKKQNNNDKKNKLEKTKKIKKVNINTAKLKDGTFIGEGTGFGGNIKSEVTVKDGKIINIKILSASKETPSYFNKAKSVITNMLDKQTCNVDTVSGATYSSNGIIESVQNALGLAEGKSATKTSSPSVEYKKPQKSEKTKKSKRKKENKKPEKNKDIDTNSLMDGVYTGIGTGFGGNIEVNVTIKKGKITKIAVISAEYETASYFDKAKGIINNMLKEQSTEVDVVSGATYSSNGIIEAVNNALSKAATKKKQDSDSNNNEEVAKISSINEIIADNDSSDTSDDNDDWVVISKTSEEYIYPVVSYCESYSGDFEGYDIKFNIIITIEITKEENSIKSIRTTTNNYVSAVELEQETIDYAVKTGNWAFLNMAANGTEQKIGLFEQLVSSNSVSSFDAVSGATCSSDALAYGIKDTLKNITLGKTVVIN